MEGVSDGSEWECVIACLGDLPSQVRSADEARAFVDALSRDAPAPEARLLKDLGTLACLRFLLREDVAPEAMKVLRAGLLAYCAEGGIERLAAVDVGGIALAHALALVSKPNDPKGVRAILDVALRAGQSPHRSVGEEDLNKIARALGQDGGFLARVWAAESVDMVQALRGATGAVLPDIVVENVERVLFGTGQFNLEVLRAATLRLELEANKNGGSSCLPPRNVY